jgi:hypothetical protein
MATATTGNIPACYLLGSIFASTLYSLYVLAFGASIHFLSNIRGRRVKPNKIILAVSVILFICVTAVHHAASVFISHIFFSQHWCMGISYIYTAFILHGDTPHGASAVFGGLSMSEVARFFVAGIITALLDGALVRFFSAERCGRVLKLS